MKPRLIIWDFDGVLADTEILWITVWRNCLNRFFNLNWDLNETYQQLAGMSDKTKAIVLAQKGIRLDEPFRQELYRQMQLAMNKGFKLTPGVTEIFVLKEFKQCIATGGAPEKSRQKFAVSGADQYFSADRCFFAEMVAHGKPEPDLFLLAAKKMGEKPENCLVIEDSLPGLTAAKRAGMPVIAFTAYNNLHDFYDKARALGVDSFYNDMTEIKKLLTF